MEASELIKRIRKIEIKSRGLSRNIFAGEYQTAFKGRGMTFSEVREYQYGDDVRNIDWNVTARYKSPFIKVFEEERELTTMILVDVSASGNFGTSHQFKKDLITELSAVLSFSAIQNNDKIGVILFSDQVEKFIPPKKGRQHILRIIRELLEFEPLHKETNISEAFRYLTNAIKKRCTTFVISDFISDDYKDAMRIAAMKHDLVAVKVYDQRETHLPSVGLLPLKDAETGKVKWVDSSNSMTRKIYADWWGKKSQEQLEIFRKVGVDMVSISTDEDYVKPLMSLFKRR